jgi:hypothetical protein
MSSLITPIKLQQPLVYHHTITAPRDNREREGESDGEESEREKEREREERARE